MKKSLFRLRMAEMHTWAGVVFAALLFAIFWTGALSVFDKEIDRWMMPATRLAWDPAAPRLSLDRDIRPLLEARGADSSDWTIVLPSEREPYLALNYYGSEATHRRNRDRFDPKTMAQLPNADTRGASNFLYPFHHSLTIRYRKLGAWIVGIASMGMLCALVSGVVIHRKLFAEFFTLRLRKAFGRSSLDLHNLSGVLLLPFYILITLSGLVVAFSIYFPAAHEALYPQHPPAVEPTRESRAHRTDADAEASREKKPPRTPNGGRGAGPASRAETPERAFLREAIGLDRPRALRRPGGLASLDEMLAKAEQRWGPGSVHLIRINLPGDAGGNVMMRRSGSDGVSQDLDNLRFAAVSGEPVEGFTASPTVRVFNFLAGAHYVQFSHWLLRWLYFLGGLGGCVMIATGLFFWCQARRRRQQRQGHFGVSLLDALGIAGVCGIVGATFAFFVANQWLPRAVTTWGMERGRAEIVVFYAAWALSLVHAALRIAMHRPSGHLRAWREQCAAVALLALAAVLSNWWVTGDHWLRTLGRGDLAVAGMDACLWIAAGLAALAARRLAGRWRAQMSTQPRREAVDG